MIKALLFDIDGVIVTGEAWHRQLEQTYSITQEMLSSFFQRSFRACLVGQADLKEVLTPYLAEWGWPHSTQAFLDYWFCRERAVDEQLLQVVQGLRLRGLPCFLATQQERYRTRYLQHDMGLADSFDGMFSSADLGALKSEPGFFQTILLKLNGYRADEILFWDDTPGNVKTAQSVGIQAELYSGFASFARTMQDYEGQMASA